MKKTKYILQEKTTWRVKIAIGKNKTIVKRFNIEYYGGLKKSLQKAIDYRNEILRRYGLLDRLKYEKSPDYYKANKKLACIGVYFSITQQTNGLFTNWTARYSENNAERKKHFSINKYGYEQAFLKACKIRYQHCGPIRVLNKELLPCKPSVPFIIL